MNEPIGSVLPPMPTNPPKPSSVRAKPFLLGVASGVLAASAVAAGIFLALDESKPAESAVVADSKPSSAVAEGATEVVEEPEMVFNTNPILQEFTVTLKTTRKQCFGSAGCNVSLEPGLSYSGAVPLDPDKTYSITFEVRGGEDGPVIQTMELTNQDSVSYQPIALSTTRSGSKLTAEVTSVDISE